MKTAEQKTGRAWLVLLGCFIVGGLCFIGGVLWIAYGMMRMVGLL